MHQGLPDKVHCSTLVCRLLSFSFSLVIWDLPPVKNPRPFATLKLEDKCASPAWEGEKEEQEAIDPLLKYKLKRTDVMNRQ